MDIPPLEGTENRRVKRKEMKKRKQKRKSITRQADKIAKLSVCARPQSLNRWVEDWLPPSVECWMNTHEHIRIRKMTEADTHGLSANSLTQIQKPEHMISLVKWAIAMHRTMVQSADFCCWN